MQALRDRATDHFSWNKSLWLHACKCRATLGASIYCSVCNVTLSPWSFEERGLYPPASSRRTDFHIMDIGCYITKSHLKNKQWPLCCNSFGLKLLRTHLWLEQIQLTRGKPLMNRMLNSLTVKIVFGWITTAVIWRFYFIITSNFFKTKVISDHPSSPFLTSFPSTCIPSLGVSTHLISIHSVLLPTSGSGAWDMHLGYKERKKEKKKETHIFLSPCGDLRWKEGSLPFKARLQEDLIFKGDKQPLALSQESLRLCPNPYRHPATPNLDVISHVYSKLGIM